MLQEERHLLMAARLGDRMVVIKHENDRVREHHQLIDQGREHGHGTGDLGLVI